MKFNFSGSSMLDLLSKYGEGNGGYYSSWWKDEAFAKEKPKPGIYEIKPNGYFSMTYDEQNEKIPKGFEFPHPAVLLEAIFSDYKDNFLKDTYSRTSARASGGGLVDVGGAGATGAGVGRDGPGFSDDFLGVSCSKRVSGRDTIDSCHTQRHKKVGTICGNDVTIKVTGSIRITVVEE